MNIDTFIGLFESMFRTSIPLIIAAMGTIISERAGVINLAIEGQMLIGAFAGAAITFYFENPYLGLLAAVISGSLMASLLALFSIEGRSDQVVTGMTLNIMAMGIVPILGKFIFENSGSTPAIPIEHRVTWLPLFLEVLIPIVVYLLFKKTNWGLKTIFAGENPNGLSAAGYSPRWIRWQAYLISGGLGGLAGWVLSVYLSSGFSRGMSGGRGFIAIAAMIMGRWRPLETCLICFFFGLSEAVQIQLQGVELGGQKIPVQFIQILPYLLVLITVGGLIKGSKAPKALGTSI